jgi:hypothetical protein
MFFSIWNTFALRQAILCVLNRLSFHIECFPRLKMFVKDAKRYQCPSLQYSENADDLWRTLAGIDKVNHRMPIDISYALFTKSLKLKINKIIMSEIKVSCQFDFMVPLPLECAHFFLKNLRKFFERFFENFENFTMKQISMRGFVKSNWQGTFNIFYFSATLLVFCC